MFRFNLTKIIVLFSKDFFINYTSVLMNSKGLFSLTQKLKYNK